MTVPETHYYDYQKSFERLICLQTGGRYLMTEVASWEVIDGQVHLFSQYLLDFDLADHLQFYF